MENFFFINEYMYKQLLFLHGGKCFHTKVICCGSTLSFHFQIYRNNQHFLRTFQFYHLEQLKYVPFKNIHLFYGNLKEHLVTNKYRLPPINLRTSFRLRFIRKAGSTVMTEAKELIITVSDSILILKQQKNKWSSAHYDMQSTKVQFSLTDKNSPCQVQGITNDITNNNKPICFV